MAIKNAVGDSETKIIPAFLPDETEAFTPLSFSDYVTAMRATRECELYTDAKTDYSALWISGIQDEGSNWQVPFVKCDSRECEFPGQDAQPFCEYAIVAVAPSSADDAGGLERATAFGEWIYDRHPSLRDGSMPFDFDFVKIFNDPEDLEAYVTNKAYGSSGFPKIAMGVVWEGNSATDYVYSLRQNSTNFNAPEEEARQASQTTPDTDRILDSFGNNDFSVCVPQDGAPEQGPLQFSCTGQYLYNGVLTFQRLVGDFIMEDTGSKDAGYFVAQSGVTFVQFPTQPYEENGFFADIGGT